ncbi:hypothetical protein C8J56DRAFT_988096 [Mycena floridula]|nr:hypothetical protein C8J56DRAFT_988096 [Mycena floridula]
MSISGPWYHLLQALALVCGRRLVRPTATVFQPGPNQKFPRHRNIILEKLPQQSFFQVAAFHLAQSSSALVHRFCGRQNKKCDSWRLQQPLLRVSESRRAFLMTASSSRGQRISFTSDATMPFLAGLVPLS